MQKVKEGEGREGRKVEETSSGGREIGKKMRSLAPVRGNREKMRSLTPVRGIRGKMYYISMWVGFFQPDICTSLI